ncbi:hypothetical protein NC651_029917 [Populus alba x Populus x berolinensis]|nr:hypothetical protein NC651_029917 [Populus alba x Populus x berolinensis]
MELDSSQEQQIMKGFLLLGQREVSSLLFSLFNCVFCVFLGKMSGNKQNETN